MLLWIPAQAGIQSVEDWIPACAGMTNPVQQVLPKYSCSGA